MGVCFLHLIGGHSMLPKEWKGYKGTCSYVPSHLQHNCTRLGHQVYLIYLNTTPAQVNQEIHRRLDICGCWKSQQNVQRFSVNLFHLGQNLSTKWQNEVSFMKYCNITFITNYSISILISKFYLYSELKSFFEYQ